MLIYSMISLFLAILAGSLGFWGLAGTAAFISKVLFFIFIAWFVITLLRKSSGRWPDLP